MKTIFWNVDTQYDFMRADGKLPVQDAQAIEPNLEKLTEFARQNGYQVINTGDLHNEDDEELAEDPDFVNTFPQHCMRDTPGARFVEATLPRDAYVIDWQDNFLDLAKAAKAKEIVLYKNKFDIFAGNRHADRVVETLRPDRAIVYGVATNVCVDCAVKGLLERNVEVYAVRDAIKELPNLPLDPVLQQWRDLGAKLVYTKDVVR